MQQKTLRLYTYSANFDPRFCLDWDLDTDDFFGMCFFLKRGVMECTNSV